MRVLVTGSGGLIGSAVTEWYCKRDAYVVGIDNNFRQMFFGPDASTAQTVTQLQKDYANYRHIHGDIRDTKLLKEVFASDAFDLIVHAAAQPSHDWSAEDPLMDFSINAQATMYLLEMTRTCMPNAVFIFASTNKVYGDHVNALPLLESATRWDLSAEHPLYGGIDESMSLDASMHSVFGASKVAADIMTQEYGRYFGLRTTVLRFGCVTGRAQQRTVQHGFLTHLVRSVALGKPYTVIGYGGKQVRDNIHAEDVAAATEHVYANPRLGAVYNMGGGRGRSVSVLEALNLASKVTGEVPDIRFQSHARRGDHQWYITSTKAFEKDYPSWKPAWSIERIFKDIIESVSHDSRNFLMAV